MTLQENMRSDPAFGRRIQDADCTLDYDEA